MSPMEVSTLYAMGSAAPGIELCSNKWGHNPRTPVTAASMYHSGATVLNLGLIIPTFDTFITCVSICGDFFCFRVYMNGITLMNISVTCFL